MRYGSLSTGEQDNHAVPSGGSETHWTTKKESASRHWGRTPV